MILLCILNTLADSVGNFACFAETETDGAVAVAHDYQSSELKDTTALYGFGNTVNGYYFSVSSYADASITAKSIPPLLRTSGRPHGRLRPTL